MKKRKDNYSIQIVIKFQIDFLFQTSKSGFDFQFSEHQFPYPVD